LTPQSRSVLRGFDGTGTLGPVIDPLVQAARVLGRGDVVALTGAGLSTDSGIPDYRGPDAVPRRPMTYQEFVSGLQAQRRYWARSYLGWATMGRAAPNGGHLAIAELERAGVVTGLVTQNVDGLHRTAGSRRVVDLHGRIADVVCLRCDEVTSRAALQERLAEINPGFAESVAAQRASPAPDGDAEVGRTAGFVPARCLVCDGVLKPHVVFFGENVPKDRVALCYDQVERAGALLVAGTSLAVQSGLRFVRRAHRDGTPVVLVNRGPTRGDHLVDVRLDGGCTQTLVALAQRVTGPGTPQA
jgi:NAD-dependent SIR2 family protein deacetylase